MTEDSILNTTIHEPPSATAGEVDLLLFALDRSRAQCAWKCGGLDAAGLSKRHPPPAMTLGGLLYATAAGEREDHLSRGGGSAVIVAEGRYRITQALPACTSPLSHRPITEP